MYIYIYLCVYIYVYRFGGYIGAILGYWKRKWKLLFRVQGIGDIRAILGIYWDNGKEYGSYWFRVVFMEEVLHHPRFFPVAIRGLGGGAAFPPATVGATRAFMDV